MEALMAAPMVVEVLKEAMTVVSMAALMAAAMEVVTVVWMVALKAEPMEVLTVVWMEALMAAKGVEVLKEVLTVA